MKMNLYVMIGIPGGGKSFYSKQIAEKTNAKIISSDDLREEWYGNAEDQTHNFELFKRIDKLIEKSVIGNEDIIYDATNLYRKNRKKLFELHRLNDDLKIIAVVINTSLEDAKIRNSGRERVVPDDVIERFYNIFKSQYPTIEEGFDDIIEINNMLENN